MATVTLSNGYRQRVAACQKNNTALPAIASVVFGSGGHDVNNVPKNPDPTRTDINTRLTGGVKTVSGLTQSDAYSVSVTGSLAKADLAGLVISEVGLLDINGALIGYRTFAPHTKMDDETFDIVCKITY